MLEADPPPSSSALQDEAKKPYRRKATLFLRDGNHVIDAAKAAKIKRIGYYLLLAVLPIHWLGATLLDVYVLPAGLTLALLGGIWSRHLARKQVLIDLEDEQRDKTVKNFASQQVHGAASVNAGANLASDDEFQIDLPPKS